MGCIVHGIHTSYLHDLNGIATEKYWYNQTKTKGQNYMQLNSEGEVLTKAQAIHINID